MPEPPDLMAQISCLRREVMRRAERYLELVETERMSPRQARWEQRCMVEALRTLLEIAVEREGLHPRDVGLASRPVDAP